MKEKELIIKIKKNISEAKTIREIYYIKRMIKHMDIKKNR